MAWAITLRCPARTGSVPPNRRCDKAGPAAIRHVGPGLPPSAPGFRPAGLAGKRVRDPEGPPHLVPRAAPPHLHPSTPHQFHFETYSPPAANSNPESKRTATQALAAGGNYLPWKTPAANRGLLAAAVRVR